LKILDEARVAFFLKDLIGCLHVERTAHATIGWKCFEDGSTWDFNAFKINKKLFNLITAIVIFGIL